MKDKQARLVTAEAVRRGHPDKLCDQIVDALLDEHLRQDPNSRVALEVMATDGRITIGGEVTSRAKVDFPRVVEKVIRDIGYRHEDLCQDGERLELEVSVHEQSLDIAFAVDGRYPDSDLGAGDQGILVGYATDETPSRMPRACVIAQKICRLLDEEAKRNPLLGADGKAQVTLRHEGERVYVHTIVISAQHTADADERRLRELISQLVRSAVGRADMWTTESQLLVNPSGRFVLGGPAADTGLSGRKLAVDQYGPVAHIGGGALSGKDGTKVDRSGAYVARWIAKNLVAARLCKRCEVQLAYAIGICRPVCVTVDSFGTSELTNGALSELVTRSFDLRLAALIERLELTKPIFYPLASYGHFGREELNLPWERENMAERLWKAARNY